MNFSEIQIIGEDEMFRGSKSRYAGCLKTTPIIHLG
jgi:hypothetical protein